MFEGKGLEMVMRTRGSLPQTQSLARLQPNCGWERESFLPVPSKFRLAWLGPLLSRESLAVVVNRLATYLVDLFVLPPLLPASFPRESTVPEPGPERLVFHKPGQPKGLS